MSEEQQGQKREGRWLRKIWDARSGHSIGASATIFFCVIIIVMYKTLSMGSCKPVIYLYPESPVDVTVRLDYNGTLEHTYPKYDDGWRVTAYPDGTLINHDDGLEYSYLFWDGKTKVKYDFSSGFVVRGADTAVFLREKLAHIGLTPREYNEFIVYWLPLMEKNRYNLISFQGTAYTDNAVLSIDPEPDSALRVFMAFRPLMAPIDVPPQELTPFERKGFTVVEWGGSLAR
ncbi:MAG: hypothetical protein LBL73_05115 [Synergistaceae bacterium]|jgi:hypothetical protein|nr:hypothetical protein [Synergistaceae bacterium]